MMSSGSWRDSSLIRDNFARKRLGGHTLRIDVPTSKPLDSRGYSQLEECLRSAISYSNVVDKAVDDTSCSFSKKSRDVIYHLRAINDLLKQVAVDGYGGTEFVERFADDIRDMESRMTEALGRFRRMDFLKGVHSSQKPRVALQKKKYVDEMCDNLRVLHSHACKICGSGEQGGQAVRFISEEDVMTSIDAVISELLECKSSNRSCITPQVVWMFVCRRLGRSLHDFPMRDLHHHYINHMINSIG